MYPRGSASPQEAEMSKNSFAIVAIHYVLKGPVAAAFLVSSNQSAYSKKEEGAVQGYFGFMYKFARTCSFEIVFNRIDLQHRSPSVPRCRRVLLFTGRR